MGWWERQDRSAGSSPQPGANACPRGRSLVLLPTRPSSIWPTWANIWCTLVLLRGAFLVARRGVPVTSLAASWCPAALITLPLASVCPSPLHPVHPHPVTQSVNGVICRSFHPLPGRPQPCTPIHFTHDLVLSYFRKRRPPPPRPRGRPFALHSTHGCCSWWPRDPREVTVV